MPERLRAEAGRLDLVVSRLAGVTRADAQRAIAGGRVRVDGVVQPKSHRLAGGERLEVDLAASGAIEAQGPAVPIRWRDDRLAVVMKPAGLLTHPTERRRTGSLVNRLVGMGVPLSAVGGPLRPGIVHRLDVGTSGLMIVAEDDEAHRRLAAMLKAHAIDRGYLALARGRVDHEAFEIDAPLGRRAARVVVDAAEGREARTAFEILERLRDATLLSAAPRTGRTHQIRVHLAAIGHPIVGDRAYGGAGDLARRLGLERPFLHSWRIAFDHPFSGQRIQLEEPLPPDLQRALERGRGGPHQQP